MEHSMTLVIFTFLSQLAIGAFAALFFMDIYKQTVSKKAGFISLIAILSVSVIAVIVSVFHLGHPFAAYRAILNFDDSWLTREIVFFPSFILFVIVYTFFAKTAGMKQTDRMDCGPLRRDYHLLYSHDLYNSCHTCLE